MSASPSPATHGPSAPNPVHRGRLSPHVHNVGASGVKAPAHHPPHPTPQVSHVPPVLRHLWSFIISGAVVGGWTWTYALLKGFLKVHYARTT